MAQPAEYKERTSVAPAPAPPPPPSQVESLRGSLEIEEQDNMHPELSGSDDEGRSQSSHSEENHAEKGLARSSTALSICPPPIIVPRNERRGLFGRLTVLAEVEEPKHYQRNRKWFITFVVAVAAAGAPLGSAIFYPCLDQVSEALNTSPTIANLTISLYMLSMSIFPLWWSSFSERYGRRSIYLVSFTLFVLWSILSAVSTSIEMLIVMRMLGGGASASVQAVGAGTIADIWDSRERGRAMGIFYLGPLCGPLIAPIFGGLVSQEWGWRATQWFLAIYGAATLIFIFAALPETLPCHKTPKVELETDDPALNRRLSRVSSKQVVDTTTKWLGSAKIMFVDPLKTVLYLRYPPVLLTVLYASTAFGSLYMMNIGLQQTFGQEPYNFSTIIVGLLYIPNSVGYMLSSIFAGRWMDSIMKREARRANRVDEKGKHIYRPEDRMRENAWLGALLYPGALIWFGWTAEKKLFWVVPIASTFFFGVGSMIIFGMSTTMLTEFMPKRASAGVAVNNFMRNIFACVGSFITAPIIDAIGSGWLFTIVGVVAFASSSVIWSMRHFGPRWRETMDANMK